MPQHVDQEIRAICESPSKGRSETVLLGVAEGESVVDRIESLGGEIERDLPYGGLRVRVSQPSLKQLCEMDELISIELPRELEPQ